MNRILALAAVSLATSALAPEAWPAGAGSPSAHLLAKWDFDASTEGPASDSSGNGHEGKLRALKQGAQPRRVDGMVGQAMRFSAADGTDVLIKNHERLNPTDGLTIAAWIRHEGPLSTTAEIVGKKGLAKYIVDGYRLFVTKPGRLVLEVGDGEAVSSVSTAHKAIKPDTWYHVAATFSPGRASVFLNARLVVDENVAAKHIKPSNNNLVIGNFAGRRNAYPFNGLIDEVNLFSVALDAEAVFETAQPERLQN